VIARNARAQNQLIEDLLDMSRIVSGKLRLDVREVDLVAVIRAAMETVAPAAEAKGLRLQHVLDPRAGPVRGDPDRLQQVLWNLLSNAVKYTPKGGRVSVFLERVNSHVEISVVDTGPGISADVLPYVFDRFRQDDSPTMRRQGGLGLGLAIVRSLVELHGGTVRGSNADEGSGARFVVHLPLLPIHQDAPESRAHPRAVEPALEPPPLEGLLVGVKALVVDDDGDARDVVAALLTRAGAEVVTAASAAEASALLETLRPDALVSDLGMPDEDGFSMARRLRANPATRDVPAIALSAFARPEDRRNALIAGFQMHLAKPVDPAELVLAIASLRGRIWRPEGESSARGGDAGR
jgi:CheY-like chemotaxis protein